MSIQFCNGFRKFLYLQSKNFNNFWVFWVQVFDKFLFCYLFIFLPQSPFENAVQHFFHECIWKEERLLLFFSPLSQIHLGVVHNWRHAILDNNLPTSPKLHTFKYSGFSTIVTKSLTPSPWGRNVIYGRTLISVQKCNKMFSKEFCKTFIFWKFYVEIKKNLRKNVTWLFQTFSFSFGKKW